MKKKPIKKETVLQLQTNNWNKQTPRDQDKALLFMYQILAELSENRKHGYDPEFWATYP